MYGLKLILPACNLSSANAFNLVQSRKRSFGKGLRGLKTGHVPLMLLCHSHSYLNLYSIEPKIDMEHLLSMTNVCMKFEKAWLYQTLVID